MNDHDKYITTQVINIRKFYCKISTSKFSKQKRFGLPRILSEKMFNKTKMN